MKTHFFSFYYYNHITTGIESTYSRALDKREYLVIIRVSFVNSA